MTLQHGCNFQKKCAFRFAFIAFISLCIALLVSFICIFTQVVQPTSIFQKGHEFVKGMLINNENEIGNAMTLLQISLK